MNYGMLPVVTGDKVQHKKRMQLDSAILGR